MSDKLRHILRRQKERNKPPPSPGGFQEETGGGELRGSFQLCAQPFDNLQQTDHQKANRSAGPQMRRALGEEKGVKLWVQERKGRGWGPRSLYFL